MSRWIIAHGREVERGGTFLRLLLPAGLAWGLLLVSISVGLRLPGQEFLRGFGGEGQLDYSGYRLNPFAPLTRGFIGSVLGFDAPESTETAGTSQTAGSFAASANPATIAERAFVEHASTNDDFADAYAIPSIPFTAKTRTAQATRESSEPSGCAPVGGTVWYRYRAGSNQALAANTFGTKYSTAVAVFKGSDLRNLASVRCDTDARGNAHTVFPARAGVTYYFQITGVIGGGDLVFNLDPLGGTSRVSLSSSGAEAEGGSRVPEVSADGRYAVFGSWSNDLVPGDNNFQYDVFVHDRASRATTRASVSSSGDAANDHSWMGAVSAEGRHVAFVSYADNLVRGDTNKQADVFVHDRLKRSTTRVSVASDGGQGKAAPLYEPRECYNCGPFPETRGDRPYLQWLPVSISGDGRFVAFDSDFDNLVSRDTNLSGDVFVHDRLTRSTSRASVSTSEKEADGFSGDARISQDGRYVVFSSSASNLVAGDSNMATDVFVRDLRTGTTSRVSMSSSGQEGDGRSTGPSISADGRYVAYVSDAANLVRGDTNELPDVFVRDRKARITTRVSVSSTGEQQLHTGFQLGPDVRFGGDISCDVSGDGRRVAFFTSAANLVPDDENGVPDVFVHDRRYATTTRASVSSEGAEANGSSLAPRLSSDGLTVTYSSGASNLVARDRNGREDIFVHASPILR